MSVFNNLTQKYKQFVNTINAVKNQGANEKFIARQEGRPIYNDYETKTLNTNMVSPQNPYEIVEQSRKPTFNLASVPQKKIPLPPSEAEIYQQQIQPQRQQAQKTTQSIPEDKYERAYQDVISQVFGKQAQDANRVLRYSTESGEIRGENTRYQTGKEVDIPNNDGSIDRGLFRINSNTFEDFMNRKKKLLANYGIDSYEDMYDPLKNTIMAKLIQEEQGWRAWFAAPPDLRGE